MSELSPAKPAFQQANPDADVLVDLFWGYPEWSTDNAKESPVTPHVDIIRNDWHAGHQIAVARAFIDGGRFVVEPLDGNKDWIDIASRTFLDRETGKPVEAESEPLAFLTKLNLAMQGSYLFATELHEESDCAYQGASSIPVRAVNSRVVKKQGFSLRRLLRQG